MYGWNLKMVIQIFLDWRLEWSGTPVFRLLSSVQIVIKIWLLAKKLIAHKLGSHF